MLVDLHCHSRPLSACSSLDAGELATLARRAGLDAVCLTEHDRLWPAAAARELSEQCGLLVLRGMEVTTELGHALVFGLEEAPAGMFLAAALRRAVEAAGGFMVLAHPFRAGQPAVPRAQVAALFDAVEAVNGSDGVAQNEAAAALAGTLSLPGLGGSDAHAPAEVGTAATLLEGCIADERELVAELRRGRHRAVLLPRNS